MDEQDDVPMTPTEEEEYQVSNDYMNDVNEEQDSIRGDQEIVATERQQELSNFLKIISSSTDLEGNRTVFIGKKFDDAFDESKRSHRILLLIMLDESNNQQHEFCKSVLSSEFLMELVQNHFVLWFGDVNSPLQVQTLSSMLSRHPSLLQHSQLSSMIGSGDGDVKYPVMALVSYFDNSLSVIDMMEGSMDIDVLIMKLLNAMEVYLPLLENQREGNLVRESETQQFRSEQDFVYEEALRKDQERERLKREEEEQRLIQQAIEQSRREEQERRRKLKKEQLPSEPSATEKNITTIRFKLPDNTTLTRKFSVRDTVAVLFNYLEVEKEEVQCETIHLVSSFPRMTLDYEKDSGATIESIKLFPQGALHVQYK